MTHSPAFQFYAADFLADENVVSMSLAARGAYITLICFCWREGSIPSDVNRLARLCGTDSSAMAQLWQEVCLCFEPAKNDPARLVHPRLEKEREKQIAHRKERSETGKRGAEQRWGNKEAQQIQPDSKPPKVKKLRHSSAIAKPMAKNGSSSSSSSSELYSGANAPGADAPDAVADTGNTAAQSGEPTSPPDDPTPSPSVAFKNAMVSAYVATLAEIDPEAPPYAPTAADCIQVEALRKRCDKTNWQLTPERLTRALANYRASPIGERTLADFAVRFSTFFSNALDRFGKPETQENNGNGRTHPATTGTSGAATQRSADIERFTANVRRIGSGATTPGKPPLPDV